VPAPEGGKPDPGVEGYGKAYGVIAASMQLAAAVILALLLGRWLDGKFGTAPWLMLAGLAAGFAAGMYSFLRTVQKLAANDHTNGKQG
jgi:F0F1-type ATP synthase assembly protein I